MMWTWFLAAMFGAALLALLFTAYRRAGQYGTTVAEEAIGICTSAFEQSAQKEENKRAIMALFAETPELTNAAIREALGYTERTVVRYMTELEREGKVLQVGETGRSVTYRLRA